MSITVQSIPELLTDIFAYLVDIWPAPDMDLRYRPTLYHPRDRRSLSEHEALNDGSPIMGWVNVTFVNKTWRRTAIGSPILWTDINEGLDSHWIDIFVQRSGTALIALGNRERSDCFPIHYRCPPIADPNEVIRVLPAIWHRVRYLHLVYGDVELPQAVLDCFAIPNPVLERCELMGDNEVNNVAPANGLFAGQAPVLRHFYCNLHSVTFPWNAPYVSQLRSLVICCRTGLPFLREFVDTILRRLHRVEWLDVAYLDFPNTGMVDARFPLVELPYLSRLGLEGSSDNVGTVFRHLRISDAASVELRCEHGPTVISHIVSDIHSQYMGKDCLVPMTLYVNFSDPHERGYHKLHVSAWPAIAPARSFDIELDPEYEYNSRPSSILFTLDGSGHRVMLEDLVENALPFSRATCLHAASKSNLLASSHIKIFRRTPRIETLHIGRSFGDTDPVADCHRKLKTILTALWRSTRVIQDGQVPSHLLLLPKLQEIHVALDVPGTWHRRADETLEDGSLMDKLRELVVTRAAVGAPLRAIRIVDDSLKAEKPRPRWPGDEPPEEDSVVIPDEVRVLLVT